MEIGLFIKKFISFFVEPIGMVMTLFVIGMFYLYKKDNRRAELFLLGSFTLLFLFSYEPTANVLVQNLENQYEKYDYSQPVKYIHVLGHGHNTDSDQPISSQLSLDGTQRVIEGVIIHKSIPNSKIIFTGYAGRTNVTNAVMNSRLALSLGVDSQNMIINGTPVDTREEAIFTQSIVGKEPFALVTSATHMPRAMTLFKSFGMNPIAAPTNFRQTTIDTLLQEPRAGVLQTSKIAIHEYIGILYAKIKNILLILVFYFC